MSRVFDFTHAIVRQPAASVVDGLRAGAGPSPTYYGVAAEHQAYVAALWEAGVVVDVLPALDGVSGFGVRRGSGLRAARGRDPAQPRRAEPGRRGGRAGAGARGAFPDRSRGSTPAMPMAATC